MISRNTKTADPNDDTAWDDFPELDHRRDN